MDPRFPLGAVAAALALAVPATAAVAADPPRRGGSVRAAWPARAEGKPKGRLAQWLAAQVGPETRPARRGRGASARAAASAKKDALRLVRSYDVPDGAPEQATLQNISWTYDNALAVKAFIAAGARAQAEQLLDQLMALQRADGALEFSFDVDAGGRTDAPVRSGTVAWVALAAAAYHDAYGSARYDKLLGGALTYLLAHRRPDGLIDGGDGAPWASTQHNLLTAWALTETLALKNRSSAVPSEASLVLALAGLSTAIQSALYVPDADGTAHFRQGVGDDVRPLDAQALGILFELGRGDLIAARRVADALQRDYVVTGRKVGTAGPFTGFRPYADAGAPDVLWMEGTAQAQLALAALGRAQSGLSASTSAWSKAGASGSAGPLGADRNATDPRYSAYHAWPTSAAGSWLLLAGTKAADVTWPKLPA